MSEEGGKVEVSSEQHAEEDIPLGDCEKSKGVEAKMADGQPSDLSEVGEETQNTNQEAISAAETIEETKPSQETNASDTDTKATHVTESEKKDGVEKEVSLVEGSSQAPSSTLDIVDGPPSVLDEPLAANQEEPQAATGEKSHNAASEEPQAAPKEEPPNAHLEEPQSAAIEDAQDVTPEGAQTTPIEDVQDATPEEPQDVPKEEPHSVPNEDPQDAPKQEPQDATPEDTVVLPPKEPEGSVPLEPPAASPQEASKSSEEPLPSTQVDSSSEGAVNGALAGQEVSKTNETETPKFSHAKPAPPKVAPKPKYEAPEIKVDLFVKAHASFPNRLGDCPFCHRIMMILKLKKIGGTVCPVNLNVKSREFEDFCAKNGLPTKVPIIQHGDTVISDSNAIADYLDKIRPVPKLVCLSEATNAAGDKVFLKFSAFIKNKMKSNDAKLAQALTDELGRLNTFLSKSPGCFLDGDDLLHPDCILLPKLNHVRVAAKHYKKYDIPDHFKSVHSYLASADKHPVFASTKPPDDAIIEGWRKHAT